MIVLISLTLLCTFCSLDVAVLAERIPIIQGGEPIDITQVPYQLALEKSSDGEVYSYTCGAVIIGDQWALTAAHCVVGRQHLRVRAGATNRTDGEIIYVETAFANDDFNSTTLDYDIALLKMQTAFSYSDSVRAIPLATEVPADGTQATASGWGITEIDGQAVTTLRAVELTVLSLETCREEYAKYGQTVTDRMLCAGLVTGERNTCSGDSGGPLASGGKLIGITSWGHGCSEEQGPALYANVVNLRSWINEVLERNQ